ncbi:MAG: hypothetical protein IJY74_02240, partial [Oscillospiraceae bacterium]|nr:hypothetical protein [Oscillospiraceae bacterium]
INQVHSFAFIPTGKYDKIYQYDGSVYTSRAAYNAVPSLGNVFIAEKQEVLSAVGFWTRDAEIPYTISIYTDINDGSPIGDTLLYTQSGTELHAGYHTVNLNKLIEIESGDKFSVVIKLDKISTGVYYDTYPNATANGGGSYYVFGDVTENTKWNDANSMGFDVCVKALTVEADPIVQVTDSDGNVKKYATLDAAINYAESLSETSEIKFLTDISGSYEISAGNIYFNTCGYTLSGESDYAPALTISGGTVNLYSPVINNKNGGDAVRITGGSAAIAGGTYTSEESGWALNIAGGSVNIVGGTFICSDDGSGSITTSVNTVRSYVPVGYAIYGADGNVLVNYDSTVNSLSETLRIASHSSHINGNYVDEGTIHTYSCIACGISGQGTHNYTYYDNNDNTHSIECTICNIIKTEKHKYGECSDNSNGTHKQICIICNAELDSNHDFGSWSDNGDGTHSHFCDDCNAEESKNHNYGEWTDYGNGIHIRLCTDCDADESGDHEYGAWSDNKDGTHSRFCSLCNSEDTAEHNFSETDWSDNGDGNHIHSCPDCGASEINGHDMTDWLNVPSDNCHLRYCETCAYYETGEHIYGKWSDNGDGTHSRTCTDCGAVETLDHSYTDGDWLPHDDSIHIRTCPDCGAENTASHVLSDWSNVPSDNCHIKF